MLRFRFYTFLAVFALLATLGGAQTTLTYSGTGSWNGTGFWTCSGNCTGAFTSINTWDGNAWNNNAGTWNVAGVSLVFNSSVNANIPTPVTNGLNIESITVNGTSTFQVGNIRFNSGADMVVAGTGNFIVTGTLDLQTNSSITINTTGTNTINTLQNAANTDFNVGSGSTVTVTNFTNINGAINIDVASGGSLIVTNGVNNVNPGLISLSGTGNLTLTCNSPTNCASNVTCGTTCPRCTNPGGVGCVGGTNPSGPLPVELVNFSANTTEVRTVELSWATASELNNDHFVLQRNSSPSEAGELFELATLAGAGTTTELTSYSHTDLNPGTGKNYYRLKQVDYDGKTEYTGWLEVDVEQAIVGMRAYPSPVRRGDKIFISFGADGVKQATLHLVKTDGSQQVDQQIGNLGESNLAAISTDTLTPGLYVLQLNVGNRVLSQRVVVVE